MILVVSEGYRKGLFWAPLGGKRRLVMGSDDEIGNMGKGEFYWFMCFLLLMALTASFYLVRLFHQIAHGYNNTEDLRGPYQDSREVESLVTAHKSFLEDSRIMYPTG